MVLFCLFACLFVCFRVVGNQLKWILVDFAIQLKWSGESKAKENVSYYIRSVSHRGERQTFFLEPFIEIEWITYGESPQSYEYLYIFNSPFSPHFLTSLAFILPMSHLCFLSFWKKYLLHLKEPFIILGRQDVRDYAVCLVLLQLRIPSSELRPLDFQARLLWVMVEMSRFLHRSGWRWGHHDIGHVPGLPCSFSLGLWSVLEDLTLWASTREEPVLKNMVLATSKHPMPTISSHNDTQCITSLHVISSPSTKGDNN